MGETRALLQPLRTHENRTDAAASGLEGVAGLPGRDITRHNSH
jgi:hypothetical protein